MTKNKWTVRLILLVTIILAGLIILFNIKVKENNIDNVLIAFKLRQKDNAQDVPHIMTGYCNLDMTEKQELIGHIQVDVIDDMIKQNYLTN